MISLGLHMICRAEAESLDRCLASCAPVKFDQIVVGITSPSRFEEVKAVIEKHGGEAVDLTWLPKFQFEDYGECIASFAQARNEVYKRLVTDWAFWLDADDELDGAEKLRPLVEQIDAQGYGALMLPYFYGFDADGNCITILTRERAVKRAIGWQWVRRVHEGLMALGPVNFARSPDTIVRHVSPTGRGWPERNLKLLLMDFEDNPNDKRTVCYIGHQYYAMQRWAEAAQWYERYLRMEGNKIERWQALHFVADCYRNTGRLQEAMLRDLEATTLFPDWADPYFGLAETAARAEDWEACIWWDKMGRMAKVPEAAIFTNPLDYSYNPALFAPIAYERLGDIETARQMVADALRVSPGAEYLQQQLARYDQLLAQRKKAAALLEYWEGAPDEVVLETPIPPQLEQVPQVKGRIARAAFNKRSTDSPWAIFFCGRTVEPWGPPCVNRGGIGGSETAVIYMAALLAQAGWHVDVFNLCGQYAGLYNGVGYWPFEWYKPDMEPDLLVAWRQAGLYLADAKPKGKVKWLWVHDLHMGEALTEERAHYFDRVMGVSQWHSNYLKMVYPFLENLKPTRNGISLARFSQEVERNPHKVVYASSADRGLIPLLEMWPQIKEAVPDAELHVFYGWNTIDRMIKQGGAPALRQLKATVMQLLERTKDMGVVWRGRVGQRELAQEFLSAGMWAYPTSFLEVSCITAMSCQAAGLAIVSSQCGALPETVGDRGILLPGQVNSDVYRREFINTVVELLQDEEQRAAWGRKGQEYAPNFRWEYVAREWLKDWEETIGSA